MHQFAAGLVLMELIGVYKFTLAMGLSTGGMGALTIAGVFDFETGVKIVQKKEGILSKRPVR